MSKVIVERPRAGGNGRLKKKQIDTDLLPKHEGMKVPHILSGDWKSLNENLAPLKRFLTSRSGKIWNDVYSEISANLRADNAVQQHVRDHLEDYVATKTHLLEDGTIMVSSRFGRYHTLENCWYPFYVHPVSGILCRNDEWKSYNRRQRERFTAQQAERAKTEKRLPDGREFRKVDGIWYQVEIKEIPPAMEQIRIDPKTGEEIRSWRNGIAYDVIEKKTVERTRYRDSRRFYCASKRQLNHTELKHLGFTNN